MARKIVALAVAFLFAAPAARAEEPTHIRQSIANMKVSDSGVTSPSIQAQRPSWAASRAEEKALIAIGLAMVGFYVGEFISGAHSEEGAARTGLICAGAAAGIYLFTH